MDPRDILEKTRKNINEVDRNIQSIIDSLKAEHLVNKVKPRPSSEGSTRNSNETVEKPIRRKSSFDDMLIERESFLVPCFEDCVFGVILENNTAKTLSVPEVVVSVLQSEDEKVVFRAFTYKYRVMHVDDPGDASSRIPAGHMNEKIKDIGPNGKFKVLVCCTNPQLLKKSTANPVLMVHLLDSGKYLWEKSINSEDFCPTGSQLNHLKDIIQVRSSFANEIVISAESKVRLAPLFRDFVEHKLKLEEVSRAKTTFDVDICFYSTQERGLLWGCLIKSVISAREPSRIMVSLFTRTSDQMRLLNIEIQGWLHEQGDLRSCPLTEEDNKMIESLSATITEELKLSMQLVFMQQNNIVPSDVNPTRAIQTKAMVSNWLKSYVAAMERSDSVFLARDHNPFE